MKGKHLIIATCFVALAAVEANASVFSASGGNSLQGVFNDLGYSYIDVAEYQTDLNFKLEGMMEFQLLNKSMSNLSFGVLEKKSSWWGSYYRKHGVFGSGAEAGTSGMFDMSNQRSSYGFFVSKPNSRRWLRRDHYYSYSGFNRGGAAQALFYQDPLNSNSYLLAWEGMYVGSSRSDKSYDDLVVRMTVHPAPEPATWVLLASGLVFLGVFVNNRRKVGDLK